MSGRVNNSREEVNVTGTINNSKRRRMEKEALKQRKPDMPRKMMEAKAYAAGVRAAQGMMHVSSNPFMHGTLFWMQWRDGYTTEMDKIVDKVGKQIMREEVQGNG